MPINNNGPIKLGDMARDSMTGFEGKVIAITDWLYGCRRFTLQPVELDKDGNLRKTEAFDEPQLVLVEETPAKAPAKTGGPRPEPERHP